MSKLNILLHLNAYQDGNDTNNPSQNNFKWTTDLKGLDAAEPNSNSIRVADGQELTIANGVVALNSDDTTTWKISLKSNNTYEISSDGGSQPEFRTSRNSGADATTEVTTTKNATLLTFTSTGGQVFDLIANGVVVGDEVRIGSGFNPQNQGVFKVLSVTPTSFTVENLLGVAEGPITLGVNFPQQINIYSGTGVQIGDKVELKAGFSPISHGVYEIVDVSHDKIWVYSNNTLPNETGVPNLPESLQIYTESKKLIYIESDQKIKLTINETEEVTINPMFVGVDKKPGMFLASSNIKSAKITNNSGILANIFYVMVE